LANAEAQAPDGEAPGDASGHEGNAMTTRLTDEQIEELEKFCGERPLPLGYPWRVVVPLIAEIRAARSSRAVDAEWAAREVEKFAAPQGGSRCEERLLVALVGHFRALARSPEAGEAPRKWRHPTWCAMCGEQIVYRDETHRCPAPGPAAGEAPRESVARSFLRTLRDVVHASPEVLAAAERAVEEMERGSAPGTEEGEKP
jgi:hypothetical protein